MIKAIIIDDEQKCIQSLFQVLAENCPTVEVVAQCNSAKSGIKAIKSFNPDLVFLDIEMPWMNGFEMLEIFDSINFDVIFTTAYDEFAVRAFRISAIDYLLKPIDPEELKSAVNKSLENRMPGISDEQFEVLINNIQPQSRMKRIALPIANGFQFIPIDDIIYFEADGSYTYVYLLNDRKMCVVRRLKQIESLLEHSNFCRIHHSSLINLDHAVKYIRGDGGYVVMVNGISLNVSRNRKKILMRMI